MTNKKINVENREKQFLKIAAKHANNPMLNDIKFLYMNNEIKTIRGVESNLNKPIKLKKDGTPYAASVKRLNNIKNKVQKLKAPKQIKSDIKIFDKDNINNYSLQNEHIIKIYDTQKNSEKKNIIIQTIKFYENNKLMNTEQIEAIRPIKGQYKKKLSKEISNKLTKGGDSQTFNKIIEWIEGPPEITFINDEGEVEELRDPNKPKPIYTVSIDTGTYEKFIEPTDHKKKNQVYKNDVNNACLYNGCLSFFNTDEINKKKIYNRLIKNSSEYAKPYTEQEIYKICNLTESNIIIKDVFNMNEKEFKPTDKRAKYNIKFINSRFNHVDILKGNKEDIKEVENLEAYEKIKTESPFYVEAYGQVMTLNGNYKVKENYFSTIWNEWKERNNYNDLLIDTQAPEMKIIDKYFYSMHHFINNDFIKDNDLYIEVDIIKAYYNYKDFNNYEGLPSGDFINSKCSEKFNFETFKEQNKNGLIGYYEIEILQIKEDKKKLFEILGFREGKKYVLTTAQIKTLSPFIQFKFLNYSIAHKVNISFDDKFLIDEDNKNNVKPYARAVGLMRHKSTSLNYNIKTDKETISEILGATVSDDKFKVYYNDFNGLIILEEEKKKIMTGEHLANYIHSLITCQIINQLLNVEDIEKKFIGVKLDSIILKKDTNFKILDTFKIKEAKIKDMFKENRDYRGYFGGYFQNLGYKAPKIKYIDILDNRGIQDDEEDGEDEEEEGEISNFSPSFLPDSADILNNKLVLTGKGGSGKSHSVLNFFSSVCVVSSCWNLSEAFKLDFPHIKNLSINKALGEQCERVEIKESVIFCDELTMWDAEQVKKLINMYPNKIIILCGDIEFKGVYFQLDSGFNTVLNLDDLADNFQIVKYIKNYRFDEDLNLILDNMRNITNKKELINYTRQNFKFLKLEDINFNNHFIGLTDTHEDGNQKTDYIESNFKDVERNYFIAKTNYNKSEFKGARVEDITKTNNYELKYFHTCHSFQGQTIKDKDLIISISDFEKYEFNHLKRMIYTATSRAKTRKQIIFIDNDD